MGRYYRAMDELLTAIELQPATNPRFSVIWMHGLGADGSDFVPVVPHLGLDDAPAMRFVFPNAPQIPVTCNGGYVMPAWYDIITLDSNTRTVDEAGILRSREAIRRLIERENQRGVPCERIFLAGFSQGGAIAYATALTHPQRLAGIIALSTYIPTPALLEAEATPPMPACRSLPPTARRTTWCRRNWAPARAIWCKRLGHAVEWREYPMPHSVCIEEIIDIGAWLRQRMAASPPRIAVAPAPTFGRRAKTADLPLAGATLAVLLIPIKTHRLIAVHHSGPNLP
jgi:phospholipase/carboxylesterase